MHGPGPLTKRALTLGSRIFARSAFWIAPEFSRVTAFLSGPWSAISRWLIVGRSMPNVTLNPSGRAGRFGSLAGLQFGLRTSDSVLSGTYDLIMYGPDATGWKS